MTQYLYILGHPVTHSKSPAMYNALYQKLGLDWKYDLKDCESDQEAKTFIDARDFLGVNITTPYKVLAAQSADIRAASVKLAEGANVLINKEGTLVAYNVDGEGCVSFLEDRGIDFTEKTVAVCGTGPTSLSILHASGLAGAEKVILLSRDAKRSGDALQGYMDRLRELAYATIEMPASHEGWRTFKEVYEQVTFSYGSYETAKTAIQKSNIIIDATPLGMNPEDKAPFDTDLLHEGQTVFDVVYGHGKTPLLAEASKLGCRTFDGQGMLVAQAVATAQIQCEISGIDLHLGRKEIFALMAKAANFNL